MYDYNNVFSDYIETVKKTCPPGENNDLSPLPKDTVVAMAYVPFQQFGEVYSSQEGLEAGTLFPELNKPFLGKAVK